MDIFKNYCQFCLEEQSSRCPKVPIDREIKQKFLDLTALKVKIQSTDIKYEKESTLIFKQNNFVFSCLQLSSVSSSVVNLVWNYSIHP